MQSLTIIFLILTVILLYMRIEASILENNTINISTSTKGLRVAHLSDIHINKLYISNQRILQSLKAINPDIIILTGDYIERQSNIPKFISLLKEITALHPTYLSLGNHDHKALNQKSLNYFFKAIEDTGAKILNNANTCIEKGGRKYYLIGIDDMRKGTPDLRKAFSGIACASDEKCVNIAFSHNPDLVFVLPRNQVDYFLCGHFHGGQIWMPFRFEFKVLRNEKLCKQGIYKGLHKINGINVYINRGLGNVLFPFRFLSVPEIAGIQFP